MRYDNFRNSFVRPIDVAQWRIGDTTRFKGEEQIVTWVGQCLVELAPATWWRRAWYWLRREAGL